MKGKDHHSISFKMLLYFLKHMHMYIEGKNVLHLLLWYICRRQSFCLLNKVLEEEEEEEEFTYLSPFLIIGSIP